MRLATTRGTNALLERRGVPVALFITGGFGDLLAKLDELPLVGDLKALLPRLLVTREVLFASERYDGGEGMLSFEIEGEPV